MVVSGDLNTRFYYTSTLIRWQKNKVLALQISLNHWCYDHNALKLHVTDFYKELYTDHRVSTAPLILPDNHPCLPADAGTSLTTPVTLAEVRKALFDMSPYKYSGPDGIQAVFYQIFWSTVSPTLHSLVHQAFLSVPFPDTLNNTYLSLLPKVDNLEFFTQL